MIYRIFKKICVLLVGLMLLGIVTAVGAYYWLVVLAPGEEITKENIRKILAIESPVFYADGKSKIGVFFEDAHRQYITYDEIPEDFVNCIVASEDHSFFQHFGVDFPGILRAVRVNIRAGRVVQGGSTITQQTAKNLFKRKDRSLQSKLKELLYALRLEYHYSKQEILEFYVNQFYVSGNGRGLGVAARYFFDKPVQELDLLECAFIAGSVKKPNFYNPFIKKDEEKVAEAKMRAKVRAGYVLRQMLRQRRINQPQYDLWAEREIGFNQGKMYYSQDTVIDLVKSALADPQVENELREHGIYNVATSGIRIVTTIDQDLHKQSLYALRKELSRLDVRLEGYDRESLQKRYAEMIDTNRAPEAGVFLFARIVSIDASVPQIEVTFELKKELSAEGGIIDEAGLKNLLVPLVKYRKNRWSEAVSGDMEDLLLRLQQDDLVYVSIRARDEAGGNVLDLEKYPEIQGAALILQGGRIRAMAGGMENRHFNRAIAAKRPMGSVIKPLVYCAAQQLGWTSVDVLNNARNLFIYQNSPYFPRPDHISPFDEVSMSWAGVHSENVATVWLLYHLCDYLSPAQFKEVAARLGLSRKNDESYGQYARRIRDTLGILVDSRTLYQTAFSEAVKEMAPDLLFEGRFEEYELLRIFHYESEDIEIDEEDISYEAEVRRDVLQKSFLRFSGFLRRIEALREETASIFGVAGETGLYWQPLSFLERFRPGQREIRFWSESSPDDSWEQISADKLSTLLLAMNETETEDFWQAILIEGLLSASTVRTLEETVEREYEKLSSLLPYQPEVLHKVRDFRVLTALNYLTGLCRDIGVESVLEPVLSFPLGSNVISLFEAARIYEGIASGGITESRFKEPASALAVIDRIEDSEGEIIFTPERVKKRVVSREISLSVSDILRNVVKYGTGRYAERNIRLHSRDPEKEKYLLDLDLRIPVYGKTGTSNRFTNSAFVGIVPVFQEGGNVLTLSEGFVLASYVGYDDNKPMVRNTTHITGSSGALPLWTRMANDILLNEDYAASLDLVDLSFSGLTEIPVSFPDMGQIRAPVDSRNGGLPFGSGQGEAGEGASDQPLQRDKTVVITFGEFSANGTLKPKRFFLPYWRVK